MARTIDKSSPYYSQYKKARSAVQSRVGYYKSQGYDVSRIKIPAIPKTITEKSVNRLEKISGQYIKAHSKAVIEVQTELGVQSKVVSGTVASKRRRHEGAVKAARTRKVTKEYREKYGLPYGYTIDPDTGEKHETPAHRKKREAAEAKYSEIADYDYDTMGEIADYGLPKKEKDIYADIANYNPETGEYDGGVQEDEQGNLYYRDTGEVLGEQPAELTEDQKDAYDLYYKGLQEGDIEAGTTFEEFLEDRATDQGSEGYLRGVLETLDEVNPNTADYIRSEVAKYRGADSGAFEQRFLNQEGKLPIISDILSSPRPGSGDMNVNYSAIADLMKVITGKKTLSGAQMRAIGKAVEKDDYDN